MTIHYLDPAPRNYQPILLLHGLGADSRSWEFQIQALVSNGYRPIVPDLPGFGKSPPLPGGWSVLSIANQVADWLVKIGCVNLPIVGISMGGAVALQLTLDYPDLVSTLVLVNTFACLRPRNIRTGAYLFRRFIKAMLRGSASQAEIVAQHLFPYPDQAYLRAAIIQLIKETDPAVYRQAMRALMLFDQRKRLSEIRIPTLVISGEQDATVPLENQRDLVERIPGARHILIPGARHAVTADHPEAFNASLLAFLREVQPSAVEIQNSH